ncbi:MAG: TetR/AcrR family transcriptional regulator [Pseudomonadota bacterium]
MIKQASTKTAPVVSSPAAERQPYQRSPAPAEGALRRGDWVEMGLKLLVEEGIDAVKITRLADGLKVTRGSFYWHFKDRADLLSELIARWENRNTGVVVAAAEEASSLAEGILSLFDAWLDGERFDPRLDSAMRDWARQSPEVKFAVARADDLRVTAFTGLFERAGFEATEAFIRARVLYFAQVGYYALDISEPTERRFSYLEAYYKGFTGKDLDPHLAETYRARRAGDFDRESWRT